MKYSVITSTHTIVRPCTEVSVINNVSNISSSICNKKQAHQVVKRQPFFIDDIDHDYIKDELERHDNIHYEIQMKNNYK